MLLVNMIQHVCIHYLLPNPNSQEPRSTLLL